MFPEVTRTPSTLILRLKRLRVSCIENISHVYPIEPTCILRSALKYLKCCWWGINTLVGVDQLMPKLPLRSALVDSKLCAKEIRCLLVLRLLRLLVAKLYSKCNA